MPSLSPALPEVRASRFSLLAVRRAWRELRDELVAEGPVWFQGPAEKHYHHLLGTACAALGDLGFGSGKNRQPG